MRAAIIRVTMAALSIGLGATGRSEAQKQQPEAPPGERAILTDGVLFVPQGCEPGWDGTTLVIHLHGAAWAAERNLVQSGIRAVLVNVTLPGLSAVYAEHFHDLTAFPRILREAEAALRRLSVAPNPRISRVVVTSFSAGFGGVRELLEQPEAYSRIDALVMADSIYAGYVGADGERKVNPNHMAGFLKFALDAANSRKQMVVSHSALIPGAYASTGETADYLLAKVGAERERAHHAWPGGLLLTSRAHKGQFDVLGFDGTTGQDHMKHLRSLWTFMRDLKR